MKLKYTLPALCLVLGLGQATFAGPVVSALKAAVATIEKTPNYNHRIMRGSLGRDELSLVQINDLGPGKKRFVYKLKEDHPLGVDQIELYYTEYSDFRFLSKLVGYDSNYGPAYALEVANNGGPLRSLKMSFHESDPWELVLPEYIPGKIINISPMKADYKTEKTVAVSILAPDGSIREYTFLVEQEKKYNPKTGNRQDVAKIQNASSRQLSSKELGGYRNYNDVVRTEASSANTPAVVRRANAAQ